MRKMLSILLVFLLGFTIVSCSKKDNNSASPTIAPTTASPTSTPQETPTVKKEPKELTMVHVQGEVNWPAYDKLVSAYEAKSGNRVKLVYVPIKDFEKYMEAQFIAGSEPDIIYYTSAMSTRASWYKNNWILDLSPYMTGTNAYTNKPWKDSFVPNAIESATDKSDAANSRLYGLPSALTTVNLYYNKDIFTKLGISGPPATITEFIADAKKAKDNGYIGFSIQNSLDWNLSWLATDLWNTLFRAKLPQLDVINKNGEVEDSEWALAVKNGIINENSPEIKEYLRVLKDLSPNFNKGFNTASWEFEGLFNDGKSAMTLNGSWYPNQYLTSKFSVNYGVAPIPYLDKAYSPLGDDSRHNYRITTTPDITITAKAQKDGKLDAALDFAQFWTDPDNGAKIITDSLLNIPVVAGVKVPELLKPIVDGIGAEPSYAANFNNFEPEQKDFWFKAQQSFLDGKMSEDEFLKGFGKKLMDYADSAIKNHPEWKVQDYLKK